MGGCDNLKTMQYSGKLTAMLAGAVAGDVEGGKNQCHSYIKDASGPLDVMLYGMTPSYHRHAMFPRLVPGSSDVHF